MTDKELVSWNEYINLHINKIIFSYIVFHKLIFLELSSYVLESLWLFLWNKCNINYFPIWANGKLYKFSQEHPIHHIKLVHSMLVCFSDIKRYIVPITALFLMNRNSKWDRKDQYAYTLELILNLCLQNQLSIKHFTVAHLL